MPSTSHDKSTASQVFHKEQAQCPGKFKRLEESTARGYELANKLSEMDAGEGSLFTLSWVDAFIVHFPVINETEKQRSDRCGGVLSPWDPNRREMNILQQESHTIVQHISTTDNQIYQMLLRLFPEHNFFF